MQVKRTAITVKEVDYTSQADVENLTDFFSEVSNIPTAASNVGGVFGSWLTNYHDFMAVSHPTKSIYSQVSETREKRAASNWVLFTTSVWC